jgi:hypothetical protein
MDACSLTFLAGVFVRLRPRRPVSVLAAMTWPRSAPGDGTRPPCGPSRQPTDR